MTNRELIEALKEASEEFSQAEVGDILEINGQTFFERQSAFIQENTLQIMLEELAKAMGGLCPGASQGIRQQLHALK